MSALWGLSGSEPGLERRAADDPKRYSGDVFSDVSFVISFQTFHPNWRHRRLVPFPAVFSPRRKSRKRGLMLPGCISVRSNF